MIMSYTDKLINHILNFNYEAIPVEVIEQAKILILDTIGCAIGGFATSAGKQIASQAKEFSGAGEASVIGEGEKISAPFACWANSSLANILDMDDVFAGSAHQANCLVPTALGIGEANEKSGREVLKAVTLGFEVGSRVMMYSWPSPSKSRTYFPSTFQIIDAVTVTGTLLGLEYRELHHAFGLAATVAPLPIDTQKFAEPPMGFGKNVFGWTTFSGVFWTLLAQKGAEGTPQIFDGDAGFWAIMGSDHYDGEKLVEGFGETYYILETKFKPYPLCTWGHSSADAALKIFSENDIDPEKIESITVRTLDRTVKVVSGKQIETIYDAEFSLEHAISMLALGKKPGPDWFSRENLFENSRAAAIAQKVHLEVDPLAEDIFDEEKGLAIPSDVEIVVSDGKVYRQEVKYSKGTPKNPFTTEELKMKFRMLASGVLGEARVEEIIEAVDNIEAIENIRDLTDLLKG